MSAADDPVATEFVTDAFDTEVTASDVKDLAETIETVVRDLKDGVVSDDRLEALLRSEPGGAVFQSADTVERSDPEPLTQQLVIEPLFEMLGYPDLAPEAGDLSDTRGQQADYSVSVREYDGIESNRLLIEAEPLNKRLDQDAHGLGQVRDWLERDKFEADFGIATDGMRWILIKRDRDTYSFDTIAEVNLQPVFLAAFENVTGRRVSLDEWVGDAEEDVLTEFGRAFGYENFLAIAGEARQVIKERKEAITDEFYAEYVRLVFGITEDGDEDVRARSLIGEGVVAPEGADGDDVRLFAVDLMNRLIFIKFLEDKRLVDADLLQDLRDAHESGVHPESLYKTYLEPLFFGVLDERPTDRSERVQNLAIYSDVPYLDGGLFRPQAPDEGIDERAFDVRDSVLTAIIDLLERYSFSADGGPTDLDPSVLGNVFEKTINHITTDSGDQQKELGAYYTPDEITSFCAEETVRPALRDRFAEQMVAEWGWTEAMADSYDDVYALIEAVPETNVDVREDLLEVVDHFRALDPACGSGHFLTSVQEEIVGIRKALYEGHTAEPADWELYKQTVVQNVYGVDIVEPAVEIAKLRLWLSIIAEVDTGEVEEYDEEELALPNVVFNVRQGNSLIGFTELMETTDDGEQAQLGSWGPDSVRAKYGEVIDLVEKHKQATDTERAMDYLERAELLLDEYREDLDTKVVERFKEAGIEDISLERIKEFHPFHWVLEFSKVYADGGFDVIVGNPPWDMLQPRRDEFFSRYEPRFRSLAPQQKNELEEDLRSNPDIQEAWKEYERNIKQRTEYFTQGSTYTLQWGEIGGKTRTGRNDLAMLFLERVFNLTDELGYVAQVLPGKIFTNASSKRLRLHLLNESQIKAIAGFTNRGIFEGLHSQFNFSVLVFQNSGSSEVFPAIFGQQSVDAIKEFHDVSVEIPKSLITEYSPEAITFPYIQSESELSVLQSILTHPDVGPYSEEGWRADAHIEIYTRDSQYFTEDQENADYPVYGGSNMYQFVHDDRYFNLERPGYWSVDEDTNPDKSAKRRVREKSLSTLKDAIYQSFNGYSTNESKKKFVNELLEEARGSPLSVDDVKLDSTEYRIVYRNITNSTNERTFVATVLPPGIICYHALATIRPYRINPDETDLTSDPLHPVYERARTDEEKFTLLGLLNSIPFDFFMRTKIDSNIARYKFETAPVPYLNQTDAWFEYISTRAARLNCYGDAFAEMRERMGGLEPATDMDERKHLQAEIDAAAFHAYGLNREETAFVLDDFHRVRDPRLMTEDYFDLVLERYDTLAEAGPQA